MSFWKQPPRQPELQAGEIHLWRLDLDPHMSELHALEQTLGPEERARANRFVNVRERSRYIVSHGVLRTLLAQYLRTEPSGLVFRHGVNGKPELLAGELRFNMSHSQDLVLYAVTRTGPVGIDVECILPGVDVEVATGFSPRSASRLARLPLTARRRVFYQGWTRMEAHAKGRGTGLQSNIDHLDRFLDSQPGLVFGPDSSGTDYQWSFHDLHPRKGYLGSLAASREGCRLKYWKWENHCSRTPAGNHREACSTMGPEFGADLYVLARSTLNRDSGVNTV